MKTKNKPDEKRRAKSFAPFQVKAFDDAARTFTGLASTWDEDLGGDVIHQGAFKRTLDNWRGSSKVLPLIDQHNYGSVRMVVGKLLTASETAEGLECSFQIIEGPDGDEIFRRVKGGFVDGLSIGYRAVKWEIEEGESGNYWDRIRHLKEVELYEVSVVIWGMNPAALIDTDSVKALLHVARADNEDADPEEKTRIRTELVQLRDQINALLTESKEQVPEPESKTQPAALATELESTFEEKVLTLKLGRLATRVLATRHSTS